MAAQFLLIKNPDNTQRSKLNNPTLYSSQQAYITVSSLLKMILALTF